MTWQTPPGLSRGDSLTVWAMLAHGEESERDRLQHTDLSRSTYHESRRRVYGSLWVQDRYVPDPRVFGFQRVGFGFSRPLADRSQEYFNQLAAFPGTVLLWALSGCAFGVFFLKTSAERDQLKSLWSGDGRARDPELLTCEPSPLAIPAFFDYEGLWTHLIERDGTNGYPRPLSTKLELAPYNRTHLKGIYQMLGEMSTPLAESKPVYLHRSVGLRRSHRQLVDRGLVARRVFVGPRAVPLLEGRDLNRLLFVTGRCAATLSPATVVPLLAGQAGVYPFLVAGGSGKVVLGFLGQAAPPPARSRPPSPFQGRLLPTLQTFLSDINLFQGDASTLFPIVDHRYDRLVNRPG